jgi:RNA polymerase-binding transcription factor DksA
MNQDPAAPPAPASSGVDLDVIAAELADVEIALARLEAGTYFTDEVTGEPLPEALLTEHPTVRSRPTP